MPFAPPDVSNDVARARNWAGVSRDPTRYSSPSIPAALPRPILKQSSGRGRVREPVASPGKHPAPGDGCRRWRAGVRPVPTRSSGKRTDTSPPDLRESRKQSGRQSRLTPQYPQCRLPAHPLIPSRSSPARFLLLPFGRCRGSSEPASRRAKSCASPRVPWCWHASALLQL